MNRRLQKPTTLSPHFSIYLCVFVFMLSAVATPNATSADNPWPMFQHDPQHTGRGDHSGPQSPVVKWTFPFGYEGAIGSPLVGADGTVYAPITCGSTFHCGVLYAIDSVGNLKWHTPNFYEMGSATLGPDGTIYVSSANIYGALGLYALNPDGTTKWIYTPGFPYDRGPNLIVGSDGTIYGTAGFNWGIGHIFALNPDGTLKWKFSHDGYQLLNLPTLGPDGTVYAAVTADFIDTNVRLQAIDPNGNSKWAIWICCGFAASVSTSSDGTIYLSTSFSLSAIKSDGTLLWSNVNGCYRCPTTPAIASDGTLIASVMIGSGRGSIKAFNPDGTERWIYPLNSGEIPLQPVIDSDGTIYVGVNSPPARLLALNTDGTLRWSSNVDQIIYSPLALSASQTLYAAIQDISGLKLYAFGPSNLPPPGACTLYRSSFPRFSHCHHRNLTGQDLHRPKYRRRNSHRECDYERRL